MTVIIIHKLYLCHGINLFVVIVFIERHFFNPVIIVNAIFIVVTIYI